MKKSFCFALLFILSLSFYSCDDFWDAVASTAIDEACATEEKFNSKTTYKTFSQLNNPIIFTVPVYDEGYNCVGSILAIWDTDKNELYDWVYSSKLYNSWNKMAVAVQPESGKRTYINGCYNYAYYVVMDPAQTELKDYPKTKSGTLNLSANLLSDSMKPKYLAQVNVGHGTENDPHSISYFSVIDTATGTVKPSVGFRQDYRTDKYRIDSSTGKYIFIAAEDNVYTLMEFDPVTNSLSPGLSMNMNTYDPTYDSTLYPNGPDDPTLHPDVYLTSLYMMDVVYADDDLTVSTADYFDVDPETEEAIIHRNLVIITDREGTTQPNIVDIDNLSSLHLVGCDTGFKINGKYYLIFEKYVEDEYQGYNSHQIIEFNPNPSAGQQMFVDTNINLEPGIMLEYYIVGTKLYYACDSDYNYGPNFNYYDFATNTKGEGYYLNGTSFNQ